MHRLWFVRESSDSPEISGTYVGLVTRTEVSRNASLTALLTSMVAADLDLVHMFRDAEWPSMWTKLREFSADACAWQQQHDSTTQLHSGSGVRNVVQSKEGVFGTWSMRILEILSSVARYVRPSWQLTIHRGRLYQTAVLSPICSITCAPTVICLTLTSMPPLTQTSAMQSARHSWAVSSRDPSHLSPAVFRRRASAYALFCPGAPLCGPLVSMSTAPFK